jgi:hypothetical protein
MDSAKRSKSKMETTAKTSVEALCDVAGVLYAVIRGPVREVTLTNSDGHRKIKRSDWRKDDLYIDLSIIGNYDSDQAMAREILRILAVDLNCYEAGESLSQADLVESQRNGLYTDMVAAP